MPKTLHIGPYPENGKLFWDMVEFIIEPWEPDDIPDFVCWFCTNPEFSNVIAIDLARSLNNPSLTPNQKVKITQALLAII